MVQVVSLGGFLLTHEEWTELDEPDRLDLLWAFAATTHRGRCDESYESYELTVEPMS